MNQITSSFTIAQSETDGLAARFFELFRGSDRTHGIYRPKPIDPAKPGEKCDGHALTVPGAATVDLWQRHLDGACGLGIVAATADGTCCWGAIDVDDYTLNLPTVARKVKAAGLPLIVCRTKSGGAHLYLFLAEPAPSSLVRRRLQEWASALGWGASEIFPKQDAVDGDNAGSWVNMPYQSGDRSLRYAIDPDSGTALDVSEFPDVAYDAAVTPEALAGWPAVTPPDVTAAPVPDRPSEPEWAPDPAVPDDSDYPGHPPCLAAIRRAGVRDGMRNEVLFNLTLVYKKEDPATAETRAMEAARSFDPAMDEREARTTIRSALKRPYHYRCRNAPLKSHCDRATCLTRRYGVRNGERRPDADAPLILNPDNPREAARRYAEKRNAQPIVCHAGDVYEWRQSHYHRLDQSDTRADLYAFLETAKRKSKDALLPFAPTRAKVDNVLDALMALVHLPSEVSPPGWIKGDGVGGTIMACRNGLLRLADGSLVPHSRDYFNTAAADFDYDPAAGAPEWTKFLDSILPDDAQAIETLQEMFGYILSGDNRQQKMFLLIGPKRCGKGTLGRILIKLLGGRGHVGLTLGSLNGDFGLQPLLGKMLAVVPDARLHGRSHTIVERLLAISGNDDLTVPRKNTTSVTVRLPARFVFLTNVLPSLSDASGTIASRFVVFNFAVSFFGREDLDLERRLTDELPGILNWSMTGWRRLQERGHFIQPGSGREIATNLGYLASPMTQFIEETYELREGEAEVTDHVYAEWTNWWSATGQSGEPGNTTSFGLKLAAAFPHIRKRERKKMVKGDVRRWFVYEGLQRRGSEGKVDQGEMDIYRDDAGGGGAPF